MQNIARAQNIRGVAMPIAKAARRTFPAYASVNPVYLSANHGHRLGWRFDEAL